VESQTELSRTFDGYEIHIFDLIRHAKSIDARFPSISLVDYIWDKLLPEEQVYIITKGFQNNCERDVLPSPGYFQRNYRVLVKYAPWEINDQWLTELS